VPSRSSLPSATVVAHHLSKSRGLAPILVDVDITVGPSNRIGIVGPNGVGKTTLLRILAGLEPSDAGRVVLSPPAATVGYLSQEPELVPGESLRDLLLRRTGVAEAERRLELAAAALGDGAGSSAVAGELGSAGGRDDDAGRGAGSGAATSAADRYSLALERYLALGGPDIDARVGTVLEDLAMAERLLDMQILDLSGGQRARSSLAALLLSRFDVLLLDEPTNDLDFDGLARLERFLEQRQGGLVVVSHDRAFLERIVTSVVEIDEASHRAKEYRGGWTAYLEARETARLHAEQAYAGYLEERDRLKARERLQRQWSVNGVTREKGNPRDNDRAQRDFRINRTEKQAAKVRITEKALHRLDPVERPFEPWQLHLDLASARRSGDVVARLRSAVVRRGEWRLGPVDLEVRWADRLAILGPNGSGKTTLISAILGRLPLESGEQWLGPSVVVGELGQERRRLSAPGVALLEAFLSAVPLTNAEGRSLLAKFGLGAGHVLRPATSLSPGERTRAELALLMARGTNCLVLDEPTNHLDLPAIEQLEHALQGWEGTLMLVTHDRRLLESVSLGQRLELLEGHPSTLR
jgi:ATPase subunit of ABC transporter with duplicated ATPase domains